MQFDPLREPFEFGGVMLALIAIITGVVRIVNAFAGLRIQIGSLQTDLRGIRYRIERIESHLAPPSRP